MIKDIHYAGYSTEPSDYECADGQLATSLNLINEDSQLKPLFQPAVKFALDDNYKVVFVHNTANYKHYIVHYTTTSPAANNLYWFNDTVATAQSLPVPTISSRPIMDLDTATLYQISAIGNTLIVLTSAGVNYILWNAADQEYEDLGQKPPQCDITFALQSELVAYPGAKANGKAEKPMKLHRKVTYSEVPIPTYHDTNAWLPPKPIIEAEQGNTFGDYDFSLENMTGDGGTALVNQEIDRITSFALAGVNSLIQKEGNSKGRFIFPFYVRYAYELYDGSLIMHSYPVLMIPNSRGPIFAMNGSTTGDNPGFELDYDSNHKTQYTFCGRAYAFASKLAYKMHVDALTKWKDIIRGVNIFVTPPIYTYDQAGKVYGWKNMDGTTNTDFSAWDSYYTVGSVMTGTTVGANYKKQKFAEVFPSHMISYDPDYPTNPTDYCYYERYVENPAATNPTYYNMPSYVLSIPEKNENDIREQLISENRFYKISELKIDDIVNGRTDLGFYTVDIKDGTLQSLVTRETMVDDYHTHDTLISENGFIFNGRLNLGGVERVPHNPLLPAAQFPHFFITGASNDTWQVAVKIKDNANTITLLSGTSSIIGMDHPRYVYYPDPKAFEAIVTNGTTKYKIPLTEHPNLNGAYWCFDLWSDEAPGTTTDDFPTATSSPLIEEYAKVYTSAVNNPFFFPVLGINTVGTGKIKGICAAVKALSQGQFGQFPLYAFTDEGVWALETASDGSYSAKQPVTRDVCTNRESITQLDDSVLFTTARGIMMLSGSEAQCISDNIFAEHPFNVLELPCLDQLHAKLGHGADTCLPVKSFLGFLDDCQMVYDYIHQHIIVFNPTTTTTGGVTTDKYTYAYVYSLKSKQWGMMYSNLDYSVNSYPDALAVTKKGKLVSFSGTNETSSKGLFVTRPLKLEAPDIHKTISALIQRGHFERGDVGTVLYGSRDLYTWRLVWSSKDQYLRGFRGTPYKYFRIAGLTELTDGKSVFGASVTFEPRHTNNLR